MANTSKAVLYGLVGYLAATLASFIVGVIAGLALGFPSWQELGFDSPTRDPSFTWTQPVQPLINLVVWPFFARAYFRRYVALADLRREAIRLGVLWLLLSIVVDYVAWVLPPHPYQLTHQEFYVDYQPWITLIYLAIFLSPPLTAFLIRPSGGPQS